MEVSELRRAGRTLVRSGGYTATAIATLALALAAVVTIAGVVRSVILRPLPYPDSERIVRIDHAAPGIGATHGLQSTQGMIAFYQDRMRTLSAIAAWFVQDANLSDDGAPERIQAAQTTWQLSDVLATRPMLGRFFTADDDAVPGNAAVVLTHGLWRRRFGADPGVIGRNLSIDGVAFQIIGVMPEGFAFPTPRAGLLVPLRIDPTRGFGGFTLDAIGRMAPGATPADVQRELATLIPRLPDAYSSPDVAQVVNAGKLAPLVTTWRASVVRDVTRPLWVLLGGVVFVLLIACTNVVNLAIVRADARAREVAMREALGASRVRLLRLFLVESSLVAAVALAVALGLTILGLALLRTSGPADLPRLNELGIDVPLVAIAVALAALAGLGLGLVPMARRTAVYATLREGGSGFIGGRGVVRVRTVLAAGQVALSMVLLVSAGLMIRSYSAMRRIDHGFVPDDVLTFELGLPRLTYRTREAAVQAHNELLRRIRTVPGVSGAGITTCLPLCGSWAGYAWRSEDQPPAPGEIPPVVATRRVSAGYLETLRVKLLQGRLLTQADEDARTGSIVVSKRFEERLWPGGESALGKHVYHGVPDRPGDWYTVVGVVANTPIRELTDEPSPMAYLPLLSSDSTRGPGPWLASVAVRTTIPSDRVIDAVRRAIAEVDPALPMARVRTLESVVSQAGSRAAFTMVLLVVAATIALVLGVVGTYGVLAYVVNRRSAEFGIRMALGAQRGDISGIVVRHTVLVVGSGVVVGLVGAATLTRLLGALLYGVTPGDAGTYGAVAIVLALSGAAAAWLPARRASRVPPMEVLRSE